MSSRQPTRRYEARRAAIVASAIDVLNRKGVKGMTLGEVAGSLDLVPTGVIYYFKNKEELAQACFLQGIERFNAVVEAARGGDGTAERLSAFVRGYFELRRRIAVGEIEAIAVFNDVRALNAEPVNSAYVDMFKGLRELLRDPAITAGNPLNVRTHMLMSEAFWAMAWLNRWEPEDYGWLADRVAGMILDGLAAPGVAFDPITLPPTMQISPDDPSELFLRAATELMNEQGYAGASVEKISARLNVTKGAFYHHNDTKDDLVEACFQRTINVTRGAIRGAVESAGSGYQALASVAASLVRYQMSGNAPLLRTSALTSAPEAIQPRLIGEFNRLSDRFASLICDGVADGSLRAVDANVAAQRLTGMINAAAELPFWSKDLSPDAAVELFVRPFFEGLARR